MRFVFASVLGCALVVNAVACGSAATPPAEPPPRPVDPQTRVEPKYKEEPQTMPRLIAPPPAYGNKIVMAQRAPSGNRF